MGTNFYMHSNVCSHCGRGDEPKHIGKSSAGWCFSLRVYPDEGINDLPDWVAVWQGNVIKNEYGERITSAELMKWITEREWKTRGDFDYAANHAQPGPKGLARSRIDGFRCVGHGSGTWDLIATEFS